jgi:hypothetical protein
VYSIPLAGFSDSREPCRRAADIRLVSAKPAGVQVEELLGITFDPGAPHDPFLYAADAVPLRVIRGDVNDAITADVLQPPFLLTQMRCDDA